jgi:hypothetical protein
VPSRLQSAPLQRTAVRLQTGVVVPHIPPRCSLPFACSGVAWPAAADLGAPAEAPWAHLFGAANVPNLDR